MCSLLCSPPFVWFICERMRGLGVPPAALPAPFSATRSPALSVYLHECGAAGSASGQTACPVHPTLRQSQSRHSNASPLRPGCPSPPLLPVWMNVYFLCPCCRTTLPFDFLSVLVVRGGAVCLPTPPSWFSRNFLYNKYFAPTLLRNQGQRAVSTDSFYMVFQMFFSLRTNYPPTYAYNFN